MLCVCVCERERDRLPFWSYVKLIFTGWLVTPCFSGAAYVYEHYVWTYIEKNEPEDYKHRSCSSFLFYFSFLL
ncbi:hypothetical protein ABFX02_09G037900 [Erythranthe guttata]